MCHSRMTIEMKKIIHLLLIATIGLISCNDQHATSDNKSTKDHKYSTIEISCERIKLLKELKKVVGQNSWTDFSSKPLEGPICFLQGDTTLIFNPTIRIIDKLKSQQQLECNDHKLILWKENYASGQFCMATSIERTDTSEINYQLPVEFCSSVEETRKIIKDIDDTEEWATLVIHEMFHHFQLNHEPFKQYYLRASKKETVKDDIIQLFSVDSLYKKYIIQENNLLLKCIQSTKQDSTLIILQEFINIRKNRLKKYSQNHKSIEYAENVWEKLEGSARYMEYNLMETMKTMSTKAHTEFNDTLFKNYKQFEKFNIDKEPWLYQAEKSEAYFYATGFNILRVLDRLNINYRTDIFIKPEKPLADYIIEYIKTK